MNSKQSIGVVLMLSLMVPLTACGGGDTQEGGGKGESPAVTSPTSPVSPMPEGGEGDEGDEKKEDEGGEGGEG